MKLQLLALFLLGTAYATNFVFKKIEQCSSSGKTSTILKCQTDKSNTILTLEMNITESVDKMNVRTIEKLLNTVCTPLSKIKVSVIMETLAAGKYVQLFKFPDIDWCKFMKKGSKSSALVKLIFDAIKSSSSSSTGLMHRCPYFGPHAANISVSTSVIRIVPPGLYRLTCLDRSDNDENFFTFKAEILINHDQDN